MTARTVALCALVTVAVPAAGCDGGEDRPSVTEVGISSPEDVAETETATDDAPAAEATTTEATPAVPVGPPRPREARGRRPRPSEK